MARRARARCCSSYDYGMDGASAMSSMHEGVLASVLIPHVRRLLADAPGYIAAILDVAFSPREYLRKLVLVSLLQLLASTIKRCSRMSVRSLTGRTQAQPKTYGEWRAQQQQQSAKSDQPLTGEQQLYCSHLGSQAENYVRAFMDYMLAFDREMISRRR